jgi:large subunit ribosomal protein L32
MPVPKRRTSRSKRDKRRAHDALGAGARGPCPQCGAPRRPHHVCPSCGSYRGREVVQTDEE